jgi:sugar/nucleoside kinase (ribokinase family)
MPKVEVVCVGLTTLDAVYTVAHHPEPDEKITAARQDLSAGGPAANAAITAAALGSRTTLVTALGRHPLAVVARHDLDSHGVTVLDATPDDDSAPALSSVYVQPATARRSVVSVNATDRHAWAPSGLAALITGGATGQDEAAEPVGAVLVDGHHPELARTALEAARAADVTTLLDGGSWKSQLDGLLEHVDWAVCGERFRVPGAAPNDAGEQDTVEELLGRGVTLVAFTHGPRPVTWRTAASSGTVEVPTVHAMDTLGAGDAFHGAVAHELARRRPGSAQGPTPGSARRPERIPDAETISEVFGRACRVAALRVTVLGPRAWLGNLARL